MRTVCLRMQVNPKNEEVFSNNGRNKPISWERAYFDWVACNLVLHLVVLNFMG